MRYFYTRISSKGQNLARQLAVAKEYKDVDKIFCDKQTGTNFERSSYQEMKELVKSGDEVIIKELDRLGRNKEGIKQEIKWFKDKGVILRILDVPTTLIDFQGQDWLQDMVNNILIEVIGAIAEQEVKKTKQRQREGINAMPVVDGKRVSLKTGNPCGRPKVECPMFEKYRLLVERGEMTINQAIKELNISRSKWYRLSA
jgi:DNA invertase Pin-like site-specific DNA recombinase